jgi:hypothetical protein
LTRKTETAASGGYQIRDSIKAIKDPQKGIERERERI